MRTDIPKVDGKIKEGIIVLTINYDQEFLLKDIAFERLKHGLTEGYFNIIKDRQPETESCIVKIESDTAGTPLIRALFELWREIRNKDKQVICVNFPKDYVDSLASLGLTSLPGFSLAASEEEAIMKLSKN